ncbi:MAG: GntR family transcriptional regulator [Oscillospiraceae bacterium]|nr:GntR family transcriptional regulator [Oscillospiraceae bacterium]
MKLHFDNARPIFEQIAEALRHDILNGKPPPGGRITPVREMALQYGVNPNTLQRTLTLLEDEGLLYTERTSGRFVTQDESVINTLREQLQAQILRESMAKFRDLGITKENAIAHIEQHWEEEE